MVARSRAAPFNARRRGASMSNVPLTTRRLAEMRGARVQSAADHGTGCNPGATKMLTLLAEYHTRAPISSDPLGSHRRVGQADRRHGPAIDGRQPSVIYTARHIRARRRAWPTR